MACIDIYQALTVRQDTDHIKNSYRMKKTYVIYLMTWHRKVLSDDFNYLQTKSY